MRHIFRIGVLLSVLLITLPGCASTDWVKDLFGKKEGPVGQRQAEGPTTAESHEVAGEFDQVGGRLTSAAASPGAGSRVEIFHVYFGFDRWEMNRTAQTDLRSLIEKLRENPNLTVDLEGYADSVGAHDYNLQLSQKRVEAVRRYLMEKGVEAPRIRSVGLGQLRDDGTSGKRAKSRRVTIKVTVASE